MKVKSSNILREHDFLLARLWVQKKAFNRIIRKKMIVNVKLIDNTC